MRKRIMFQKGICSLLALLLAFSSLMALPVLAAGETDEGSGNSEGETISESASGDSGNGADTSGSGSDSTPEPATAGSEDKSAPDSAQGDSVNTDEPAGTDDNGDENNANSENTDNPADAADGGDEDKTGAVTDAVDPDKDNDPVDGDKETSEDEKLSEEEEKARKEQEERERREKEEQEEKERKEREERERKEREEQARKNAQPVSFEDDCIALRAFSMDSLNAQLSFSDAPDQVFTLEVNSGMDYHFYYNEKDIRESIHIEITPIEDGFITTLRVPFELLGEYEIPFDMESAITFNGETYNVSELELPEAMGLMTAYAAQPAYEGIVIDGNFDDWAGVEIIDNTTDTGSGRLDHMSVVWDGDWIYIRLITDGTVGYDGVRSGNWNAVCWAGPTASGGGSTGQYAITTDLGRMLLIRPAVDGSTPYIKGMSDARVAVNNTEWFGAPHNWEIAIPARYLPKYKQSFDFGLYMGNNEVKNVMNLHPEQTDNKPAADFNGIVFDGNYVDWDGYPHVLIEYATDGTQDKVVDSMGALYSTGETVYGHVYSSMPRHQNLGDFAYGILYNLGNGKQLEARFATADGNGNIDWNNAPYDMDIGTREFLIFNVGCWGKAPNLSSLDDNDILIGRVFVTRTEDMMETEFELYVPEMARVAGISADSIKVIKVKYQRLGDEWLVSAGTPTGPILGLALCFSTVGGVYAVDRRKKKKMK